MRVEHTLITEADLPRILKRFKFRITDLTEAMDLYNVPIEYMCHAVTECIRDSTAAFTVTANEFIAALWGYGIIYCDSGSPLFVVPWCLVHAELDINGKQCYREFRRVLNILKNFAPVTNIISPNSTQSIALLKRLGFTMTPIRHNGMQALVFLSQATEEAVV